MVTPIAPQSIASAVAPILRSIGGVVVGKPEAIELTLVAVLAGGHVLVEDVPGVGKTTLARALALSMAATFQPRPVHARPAAERRHRRQHLRSARGRVRLPAGPDLRQRRAGRRDQPRHAAHPGRAARSDGGAPGHRSKARPAPLPSPFLVIATQNPIELEGTFPLPEAQLDRFLLRARGSATRRQRGGGAHADRFASAHAARRRSSRCSICARLPALIAGDPAASTSSHRCATTSLRWSAPPASTRRRAAWRQPARHPGAVPRGPGARGHHGRGRSWCRTMSKPWQRRSWRHRLLLTSQARLRGRSELTVLDEVVASTPRSGRVTRPP